MQTQREKKMKRIMIEKQDRPERQTKREGRRERNGWVMGQR